MTGHQPARGEMVGLMVSAGDAHHNGLATVLERSQVVLVPFPKTADVLSFQGA